MNIPIDSKSFCDICGKVARFHPRDGIGTYKEKSVHLALKMYFEPDETLREVKCGKFVADIKNSTGIHEIQTSGFGSLRSKLEVFLKDNDVEIIYPVISQKYVRLVEPDTGAIVKEYKSPRHKKPAEIFCELLYIADSLVNENLHFCIAELKAEETIILDGYGENKRKRATRYDTVPLELLSLNKYDDVRELSELLPYKSGDVIYGEEIKRYLNVKGRKASAALKILKITNIITPAGKVDRKDTYIFNSNK